MGGTGYVREKGIKTPRLDVVPNKAKMSHLGVPEVGVKRKLTDLDTFEVAESSSGNLPILRSPCRIGSRWLGKVGVASKVVLVRAGAGVSSRFRAE